MLKPWHLSELQQPLNGQTLTADAVFQRVSTDSRKLQPGDLFVALSGPNFNGNRFVEQARAAGAAAAVVSQLQDSELPQLLVADTRLALGQLGALNRARFTGSLTAITGSCGKTTVKEMLAAVLRRHAQDAEAVWATQGNLNNDIGVPLTLLDIAPQHRFAVIELGASGLGEIAYTTELARPQVAILNNARGAHLEGFGSLAGVVKAKGEIFAGLPADGTGVVNLDDPSHDEWLQLLADKSWLTFSLRSPRADVYASHLQAHADCCYGFVLNVAGQQQPVQLQVMGQHMVANALAAAAAATAMDVSQADIAAGLSDFLGVPGRMAVNTRTDGLRIIDDSYNANPDSAKVAIDAVANLPGPRVLVLGNMAELGEDCLALHRQVGEYAAAKQFDLLLTSGEWAAEAAQGYRQQLLKEKQVGYRHAHDFENNAQLIDWLKRRVTADMVVLVKGSRSSGMEIVVNSLMNEELR